MEIFKSIVTNVLTALYQPFWFAVFLTIFILFFYMYAYYPTIQPMPTKASKPPASPGFVHSKIHCIFVNYFALYFLR